MKNTKYPIYIFGNQFLKKVLPEIKDTKRTIDIIVFVWTFQLNDLNDPITILIKELQEALGRGVRVRILVNSESMGQVLNKCGFRVRVLYTSKLMHPKVMILDNNKAIVGSHNYSMSAFTQNLEVSVISTLDGENNELSTFFTHLWGV
jgi:phosphatidylserine/phosphatidylglycerophosphate/cardiolipin synthase-like enzyme